MEKTYSPMTLTEREKRETDRLFGLLLKLENEIHSLRIIDSDTVTIGGKVDNCNFIINQDTLSFRNDGYGQDCGYGTWKRHCLLP